MFDLTGRTALVTGASGGIGRAIAQALSEAGAKVALSGTRENVLEEVAGTLKGETAISQTLILLMGWLGRRKKQSGRSTYWSPTPA